MPKEKEGRKAKGRNTPPKILPIFREMKWPKFLFAVGFALCSLCAKTQSNNRFGLHLGPIGSELQSFGTEAPSYDLRLRFYAGIFHEVTFDKNFGFVTEVAYAGQGGLQSAEIFNDMGQSLGLADYRINLNYMQVPVMFRAKSGGEIFRGFADVGGYFGVLVTAIGRFSPGSLPDSQSPSDESNLYEKYEVWDAGVRAAIGLEIQPMPAHVFFVRAQFSQGLMDIASEKTQTKRNQLFGLSLGYYFEL